MNKTDTKNLIENLPDDSFMVDDFPKGTRFQETKTRPTMKRATAPVDNDMGCWTIEGPKGVTHRIEVFDKSGNLIDPAEVRIRTETLADDKGPATTTSISYDFRETSLERFADLTVESIQTAMARIVE